MIRAFALVMYYGFTQYLPLSHRPGGRVFRWLRRQTGGRLLAHCGADVNIEARVDFGSGRNVSLGDHAGIGARSRVEAAEIGPGVIIAPEVMILARNHVFDEPGTWIGAQGVTDLRPVTIGEGAWIGARAIILPGVTVGPFAVIGAGAVVTKDVPSHGVAVGNPARVVRVWSEDRQGS